MDSVTLVRSAFQLMLTTERKKNKRLKDECIAYQKEILHLQKDVEDLKYELLDEMEHGEHVGSGGQGGHLGVGGVAGAAGGRSSVGGVAVTRRSGRVKKVKGIDMDTQTPLTGATNQSFYMLEFPMLMTHVFQKSY